MDSFKDFLSLASLCKPWQLFSFSEISNLKVVQNILVVAVVCLVIFFLLLHLDGITELFFQKHYTCLKVQGLK